MYTRTTFSVWLRAIVIVVLSRILKNRFIIFLRLIDRQTTVLRSGRFDQRWTNKRESKVLATDCEVISSYSKRIVEAAVIRRLIGLFLTDYSASQNVKGPKLNLVAIIASRYTPAFCSIFQYAILRTVGSSGDHVSCWNWLYNNSSASLLNSHRARLEQRIRRKNGRTIRRWKES